MRYLCPVETEGIEPRKTYNVRIAIHERTGLGYVETGGVGSHQRWGFTRHFSFGGSQEGKGKKVLHLWELVGALLLLVFSKGPLVSVIAVGLAIVVQIKK